MLETPSPCNGVNNYLGLKAIFVRDRQTGQLTPVNVDSNGLKGNCESYKPVISADGRYVTFQSTADNLVANDTNAARDIFIRDLQTGQTTRVSVDSVGGQTNADNYSISVNADGRHVAFESAADNLVASDTNSARDIFVRDRLVQVSKQADISLALSGPSSVARGSDASYTFTVTNNSSINAPGTTLIGIISSMGYLKSIMPSQGTCSSTAVPVCRLGVLSPGQSITVSAVITIKGRATVSASAHAMPIDGKPDNNAQSITTQPL